MVVCVWVLMRMQLSKSALEYMYTIYTCNIIHLRTHTHTCKQMVVYKSTKFELQLPGSCYIAPWGSACGAQSKCQRRRDRQRWLEWRSGVAAVNHMSNHFCPTQTAALSAPHTHYRYVTKHRSAPAHQSKCRCDCFANDSCTSIFSGAYMHLGTYLWSWWWCLFAVENVSKM